MDHAEAIVTRLREATEPGLWKAFTGAIDAMWHQMVYPVRISKLFEWVTEKGLTERLVKFPNCQVKQSARAYTLKGDKGETFVQVKCGEETKQSTAMDRALYILW